MYLMSDEMDSVASIRSGVYLLLRFISFEWRVHHHFRLHVIFLFCANVHVRVCVSFSVFIDLLFKRKTDRFFSLSQVIIHTQYPFCLILIWFYQYRIEIFYLNNPQPFWLIRLWNPHRAVHSLGKISNEQKPRKKIETRFRKKSTKRFNEQKHLFISINSDSKLPHTHTIQIQIHILQIFFSISIKLFSNVLY